MSGCERPLKWPSCISLVDSKRNGEERLTDKHETDDYREARDLTFRFSEHKRIWRVFRIPYDTTWNAKIMLEVLVDENDYGSEDGVQSDGYDDDAVDSAFDEAKCERPSGVQ